MTCPNPFLGGHWVETVEVLTCGIQLRASNPTAMPQSTSATVVATAEQRGAPFRPAPLAGSLKGSEILRIATEIRARLAAGERICNLTVGDFDPGNSAIPSFSKTGRSKPCARERRTIRQGSACPSLREAVRRFYETLSDFPIHWKAS